MVVIAFFFLQVKLVQHTYSCLYGTFLANNPCEREQRNLYKRTCSVWSLLRTGNKNFHNLLYMPGGELVGGTYYSRKYLPVLFINRLHRQYTPKLCLLFYLVVWFLYRSIQPYCFLGSTPSLSCSGSSALDSSVSTCIITLYTH